MGRICQPGIKNFSPRQTEKRACELRSRRPPQQAPTLPRRSKAPIVHRDNPHATWEASIAPVGAAAVVLLAPHLPGSQISSNARKLVTGTRSAAHTSTMVRAAMAACRASLTAAARAGCLGSVATAAARSHRSATATAARGWQGGQQEPKRILGAETWTQRVQRIRLVPQRHGTGEHGTIYAAVARALYMPHLAPDFAYIHEAPFYRHWRLSLIHI